LRYSLSVLDLLLWLADEIAAMFGARYVIYVLFFVVGLAVMIGFALHAAWK